MPGRFGTLPLGADQGHAGRLGLYGPGCGAGAGLLFPSVVILFVISMTDLSSSNFSEPWTFVGLENYARLFRDKFFPKILGNTFFYVPVMLSVFNVGIVPPLALLTTHIPRDRELSSA